MPSFSYIAVSPQGKQVKDNVDNFVGDAPQFDDITMLALKYTPAEEGTV